MFMFYIALALVLLGGLFWLLYLHGEKRKYVENGWGAVSVILCIVAFIICCVGFIGTLHAYSDQISDTEDLTKFRNIEGVYEDRANTLTAQFETYLQDVYPEHERGIFDQISPDSIDIYLAKYPELKASETILELVTQIRSLQDDRYDQQIEREKILKKMRYRTQNPWIFSSFVPDMPEVE